MRTIVQAFLGLSDVQNQILFTIIGYENVNSLYIDFSHYFYSSYAKKD
jgi:hypothetical protein